MKHPVLRPLWVTGVTALGTCWVGATLSEHIVHAAGASAVLCVVVLCIPPLRRHRILIVVSVTALLTCGWLYRRETQYTTVTAHAGEVVMLRVEVQQDGDDYTLRVLEGVLPVGTRLTLYSMPPAAAWNDHDCVTAEFELLLPAASGLDSLMQKASGCWLAAYPTDREGVTVREPLSPSWHSRLTDFRDEVTYRIRGLLRGDTGSVVTGICLGTDFSLSDAAAAAFRRCGVTHLFAVSGLHLSVLTGALFRLLKRLRVHRTLRGILCTVAVVLLSSMIGWSPSVARAAVMCLFVTVGGCFHRQSDSCNSMGGALLVLLALDPFAAYDAGLLLSFLATFGILFVFPVLRRWLLRVPLRGVAHRLWKPIADATALTVAATVATLPITVLYFREVSLISVLSNLLMSVPSSVLLVAGCVAVLLIPTGAAFLYRPLLLLCGWLADALLWLGDTLASLPAALVSVARVSYVIWLFGSMALLYMGYRLLCRRGLAVAAVCSAIALAIAVLLPQPTDTALRVDTATDIEDTVVCLSYQDVSVLIVSVNGVNTLYTARELLRDIPSGSLQAVILLGEETAAVAAFDTLLGSYGAPLYTASTELPAVWESLSLTRTATGVTVAWERFGLLIEDDATLLLVDGTVVPIAADMRTVASLLLEENGDIRIL